QNPEREWRTCFGNISGGAKIRDCKDADRADHDGCHHHHRCRKPVGAQHDAERRGPAPDDVCERVAAPGDLNEYGRCDRKSDWHKSELLSRRPCPAKHEREYDARHRQDDRQDEGRAACRHVGQPCCVQHRASPPFASPETLESRFASPVASKRRSSRATAIAVAAKATTIAVMTNAWGTGSPPRP